MTYLGRVGAVSARVHPVSQQPTEPGVGAIVATGAVTLGDYGMFRGLMTAGPEIAAHFHRTFSESFYLLDGHVQVFDGERWADVTSGDLVYVPAGGIHGLRATEDRPAEVLTIFCPGIAREQFVFELLEIGRSGEALSPEEWTDFYRRHDQYMV